jgi:hypothetical protein
MQHLTNTDIYNETFQKNKKEKEKERRSNQKKALSCAIGTQVADKASPRRKTY